MTPAAQQAAASLAERPRSWRSYEAFASQRAAALKTATRRRLQAAAVDFRRVWWDKGARQASRAGMSLWRPVPPTGYVALGGGRLRHTAALSTCRIFDKGVSRAAALGVLFCLQETPDIALCHGLGLRCQGSSALLHEVEHPCAQLGLHQHWPSRAVAMPGYCEQGNALEGRTSVL